MGHFIAYDTSRAQSPDPPLGANATITIGTIQSGTMAKIVGSAFSDQAGTLLVQQSFDGTNWDIQNSFTVAAATVNAAVDIDVIAPYIQFKYTNGASAEGALRVFLRVYGVRG